MERKETNKKNYDKKVNPLQLAVGDLLNILRKNKNEKFQRPYDPSWTVIEIISDAIVRLKKGNKTKQVHKDLLITTNHN